MSNYKYIFPSIFERLHNAKSVKSKHLITLRESKHYRLEKQAVLVQGFKAIKELRDQGFEFKSLIATAKNKPYEDEEVKLPAKQVIQHPDSFPAKSYYLANIDLTRKILGTASRPGLHEIFAEIALPQHKITTPGDRIVVFDKVNDYESLGTLIRTAKGLGWDSGIATSSISDFYNDRTIRASNCSSLTWPHEIIRFNHLLNFFKKHEITPVVAEVLPKDVQEAWSPDYGHFNTKKIKPDSGVWFWNFKDKKVQLPNKVALVLSCEYHGVHELLDNEIRVSVPLDPGVNSLNISSAGSIIMAELNRLFRQRAINKYQK